jgi:hypothetical protein
VGKIRKKSIGFVEEKKNSVATNEVVMQRASEVLDAPSRP